MTDTERRFHETWLGMVQPSEGLVVSVPVLVEAQCMERQGREAQEALLALAPETGDAGARVVSDLPALYAELLELEAERFDAGEALPQELRLYVPEGKQELVPTRALLRKDGPSETETGDLPPAAVAGQRYAMLVWEVPAEVADLDKPETETGPWEYPAQAKFDRLLRECRVPIGLLTNGRELRLVYAPHGESSGWLSFRVADMATVGGRPILDAFIMLLGRQRWFGVAPDHQLPALLAQSRRQQADVTNELAGQVFDALEELLAGFAAAAERDPQSLLRQALENQPGHVYSGLLTTLLRLVFTLYCEDRGLLPVESEVFAEHYSVLGLYDQLERDHGRYPDSMSRRYGAYARLVSLFRAINLGVKHGDLSMPARHGELFDPNEYPFLEGWGAGSAPITDPAAKAAVDVPAISDGTVYRVLRQLIVLGGQRLSYRALDVEQIGSVYEALMGFDVVRLTSGAVRIKVGSKRHAARVWVPAAELLAVPASRRQKWLADELGFDKNAAKKIAAAVKDAKDEAAALEAMEPLSGRARERAVAGTLVIQPGPERRRTSSHYTPRSLSEPIVERTLEPLIAAMGDKPSSEALLNLVICDPAMGSGAFLVAACRYLADRVVAAWTREAAEEGELPGVAQGPGGGAKTKLQLLADAHDDVVNHARRLVAQRCLYGVDKNRYAVQLARLSLWLVTMAKYEPFTFVDHALRHGDSLVGLSFDQIRAFHWNAGKQGEQLETTSRALTEALDEAIEARKEILSLAPDPSEEAQREKARLLFDAEDALGRVRLIADLVVGAFFAHAKDKDRNKERDRRLDLVQRWLAAGGGEEGEVLERELRGMQSALLETQVPFHWMLEFPEVFYQERPDPLDGGNRGGAAHVDGFVGNPPFAGKNGISEAGGPAYLPWLQAIHEGAHGNADLVSHFFRRAGNLVGNHGAIGLIATNTIGQGDTRSTGLQYLVKHGFGIVNATLNMPWPGDAAVTVSVVHLVKGSPLKYAQPQLDGRQVKAIDSRLRPKPERPDPQRLSLNARLCYQGSVVLGAGFFLSTEERDSFIGEDKRNQERVFPYVRGEQVSTDPLQSYDRYVIDFEEMTLEEARQWPALFNRLRETVKPDRDKQKRDHYRKFWWRFAERRPGLYRAVRRLPRCLVTSQTAKHYCVSFQPTDRVFSTKVIVFLLDSMGHFVLLQSRIKECWTWLQSSTLETRLSYTADAFETFPFPEPDPRAVIPELESIGEKLYEARAKYMVDTDQGLTKTYNALKDPEETDPRIRKLRALHEEMDRAVLAAYPKLEGIGNPDPSIPGWTDIPVPPYCPESPATVEDHKAALGAFEDEVIDRLFVLNAKRAKEEAALGRAAKKGGKKTASAKGRKAASGKGGGRSGAKRKGKAAEGQGDLGIG